MGRGAASWGCPAPSCLLTPNPHQGPPHPVHSMLAKCRCSPRGTRTAGTEGAGCWPSSSGLLWVHDTHLHVGHLPVQVLGEHGFHMGWEPPPSPAGTILQANTSGASLEHSSPSTEQPSPPRPPLAGQHLGTILLHTAHLSRGKLRHAEPSSFSEGHVGSCGPAPALTAPFPRSQRSPSRASRKPGGSGSRAGLPCALFSPSPERTRPTRDILLILCSPNNFRSGFGAWRCPPVRLTLLPPLPASGKDTREPFPP